MRALIKAESWKALTRVVMFAVVVFAPATVHAQNINITWDRSPDQTVVGYTVHVGINPGVYGQTFDVSGAANTTFTFSQAVPGQRYYLAVSAYDAQNVSSALSNVVSTKINVGPSLVQPSNQTGFVGSPTSLQLVAADDGDPLNFTATGLPAGLSINAATGLIGGTPTTVGGRWVTVTVSDGSLSASRTFAWTINAAALRVTSFTSNLASPQPVGTPITLSAAATGGTAPYQFKFWVSSNNGTSWTVLRDWNTSATYTWTPTAANAGYHLFAWVRSSGATADVAEASWFKTFAITAGTAASPARMISFTTNVSSPQAVGTPITLSAAAANGVTPYQFKFWISNTNGSSWTVLRDWSTTASVTWTPMVANAGYQLFAWVRSNGVTADTPDAAYFKTFTITGGAAPSPARMTSFTSSVPTPQSVGTPITLSASATGGVAPYQFKFWVSSNNGASWSILRDWSTSNSYTWTPTVANASYQLFAWARSSGATADAAEGSYFRTFTVTGGTITPPARLASFTTSVPSPQSVGTPITLSAVAADGVAPYQFKFWISTNNGASWTVLRDWSTSASYTWTPMIGNSYQLFAWVRSAGKTADAAEGSYFKTFSVAAGVAPPPTRLTSFATSVPSPQEAGNPITLSATATGGVAPYQYKFWVSTNNGATWTVLRDWSTIASYTWTPVLANTQYQLFVWARSAGSTTDAPEHSWFRTFTMQ